MKFAAICTALLAGSAAAFQAHSRNGVKSSTVMHSSVSSRSEFLSQLAFVSTAAVALQPLPANAAKYGGFGAGSPNVMNPKEALVDDEILASSAVQSAIKKLNVYKLAVLQMSKGLEANDQADLGGFIRKELDFVQLRAALNNFGTAFDEDTQRGIDRLSRIILQDITELETANRQKEGIPRSEIRLNIMKGKLAKLGTAFDDLLAFVP